MLDDGRCRGQRVLRRLNEGTVVPNQSFPYDAGCPRYSRTVASIKPDPRPSDLPHAHEDREAIRAYDELGDAEWRRLEDTPRRQVSLEVHRRFLTRFIRSNSRVLEVDAGPGCFILRWRRSA